LDLGRVRINFLGGFLTILLILPSFVLIIVLLLLAHPCVKQIISETKKEKNKKLKKKHMGIRGK